MTGLGPFPMQAILVAPALLLAWLMARLLARHLPAAQARQVGGLLLDTLLPALVVARAAWVLQWWPQYAASPRSLIALGDGGFNLWAGAVAALAYVAWRTRGRQALRRPLLAGLVTGLLAWALANAGNGWLLQERVQLQSVALQTLDNRPTSLQAYRGQPVVLNLWASWCPPCRREMPVLHRAQEQFPHIRFVLANQGEATPTILRYLDQNGFTFPHVVRDSNSALMAAAHSRGLPTTLFLDDRGRLLKAQMGELTEAGLTSTLCQAYSE